MGIFHLSKTLRYRLSLSLATRVLCLLFLTSFTAEGEGLPYGLPERVPNTSLLIDLAIAPPAARLSDTGLFIDIAQQRVSPGIIPYSVNSPLWSDGAIKTRYFALPGTAQVEFSANGHWTFPANTVLVKNFYIEFIKGDTTSRQIVETRLMVKDGQQEIWKGFSYQWNEDGSEAHLLGESDYSNFFIVDAEAPDGYSEQRYFFPGPGDCTFCHREAAGRALGARTGQLNGSFTYGDVSDNQLRALNNIGFFTEDISDQLADLPSWPNPLDESKPIELRARAYLAANCSHCHRPNGVDRADFDVRFDTPTNASRTVGISPSLGRLDAEPESARIILPGNANGSTLFLRTQNFSSFRMPPLATSMLDHAGTDILRRWIDGMETPTHVTDQQSTPVHFDLEQNFPNPFNAGTSIVFSLPSPSNVNLSIFDTTGRRVRTLVDVAHSAGRYTLHWDALDNVGRPVASGVYFYRLQTTHGMQTRRLLLLK
jgi:uncharacterized repeat protein (TIGR03806 family)